MEKRRPHYDLKAIQAQMNSIETMNLTVTARHGIKAAWMSLADALAVIQRLSSENFYRSMTVHADSRVWQDVYHAEWKRRALYIKFQRHEAYFIVSFKER
ncbi:mRNA interferase MqsR [Candidatus Methylomirabilis lanthanidiphila]|uniref:mRNA interferase MqsR n=1 Tax=Candidatus Methylomirabilis lanthanidiphila TaxID=2211376 RepID=A0A564ZPB2_9BACT|nr:type II toxin-antitoxin system MqsR family toxin [Candidatus Methylomirabilis lanthanidiphila]VUZ86492.1 mRNA interferase MqsR [Candidatus Methylomirabilis lanthanidiphila]